jgi:hypothetical protein
MRLSRLSFALAAVALLAFANAARAELVINIDKSAQQMTVVEDGALLYTWPVSTGRRGHDTPDGAFKPFRMERDHFSQEWDDAPMPHSIFFTQLGHAIHGTYEIKNLGRPVSHGCVRLSRANAAILFDLVKQEHMANTRVVLSGEIPGGGGAAPVARRNSQPRYADEDDDVNGAPPPRYGATSRGWRVYRDDDRTVYERQYVPRRYYAAPPPPVFPFGW